MHSFRKILRILLYVFLGILILLAVAGFLAGPIAKKLLVNKVAEAGKGQYSLDLQELKLSLLNGNVLLKGIQLTTDSSKVAKEPLVLAELEELSVEGFSWLSYFLEEKLLVDRISLSQGNIELKLFNEVQNERKKEPFRLEQIDFYPTLEGQLETIRLEDLSLDQLQFSMINMSTRDTLRFSTAHLDLHSQDILVDANKIFNDSRAFYASRIDLDGHQLTISRSGNEEWFARAGRLNFDTRQDKMNVSASDLHFLQNEKGKQDSLLFFELQKVSMQQLDLQKLEETKTASLKSLALKGLDMKLADAVIQSPGPPFSLSSFSMGKQLPSFVQKIELEELDIDQVSLRKGERLNLKQASLKAMDILIDEQSAFSGNRFLHAGVLEGAVEEFEFMAGNPLHQLLLNNFSLQAANGIGSISAKNLSSTPKEKQGNKIWMDTEVKNFSLLSINTRKLPSGELLIDSLLISQPQVVLFMPQHFEAGTAETPFSLKQLDIYPAMKKQLGKLQIKELALEQLQLKLISAGSHNTFNFSLKRLDIHSQDILVDADKFFNDSRAFYASRIGLDGHQLTISRSGNEEWFARAGRLNFDTRQDKMNVSASDLHFLQNEKGKQDSLLFFELQKVSMQQLDLQKLEETKTASLKSLALKGLDMKLAEMNPPERQTTSLKPLSTLSLGENLPAFVHRVVLEELDLGALNIRQGNSLKIQNGRLKARNMLVDKQSAFAENRFLHALSLEGEAEQVSFSTEEPVHEIQVNDLILQAADGKGTISLEKLSANPQQEWQDKTWLEAELEGLRIGSIDTRRIPIGALEIDSLIVEKPEIVFYQSQQGSQPKKGKNDTSPVDLYPLIEGKLQSLRLKNLAVKNGDVRLAGLGSYYGLHMPDVRVEVKDFQLDARSAQNPKLVLHAADIQLRIKRLMYVFPDHVYTLQLENGRISTAERKLELNGFRYGYSENYESVLEGTEKNEVYLVLNKQMRVEGVKWDKLFRERTFEAESLLSEGLDVYVYKDFNWPESGKVKPMPQDIVLNIGLPIDLKKVIIRDAKVTYEEMKEGAEVAGRVNLKRMNAELRNISNIQSKLRQQPYMYVDASGQLLGKGHFESQIKVPLLNKSWPVQVAGSMDTLDITALNRIVRYNSRLAIESGTLYQVLWDFNAGREQAEGTFEVSYENLKVQLSEAASPDTTGVLKDVGSFLANIFVVDSNIAEERSVDPKKVYFKQKRKKNRSFFHYYVLAIMGGFVEAIGVPFE